MTSATISFEMASRSFFRAIIARHGWEVRLLCGLLAIALGCVSRPAWSQEPVHHGGNGGATALAEDAADSDRPPAAPEKDGEQAKEARAAKDKLLERLARDNDKLVYATALRLAAVDPERAADLFKTALQREPKCPEVILFVAANLKQDARLTLEDIRPLLSSKSVSVRKAAIHALGETAIDDYAERSLELDGVIRRETDDLVLRTALETIGELDGDNELTAKKLTLYLDDPRIEVCNGAVLGLGQMSPDCPSFLETLAICLRRKETRNSALQAVKNIGPPAAGVQSDLAEILRESPDYEIRCRAARALQAIGAEHESAQNALRAGLEDSIWSVRRTCAEAIGKLRMGDEAAVTALQRVTKDDEPQVRCAFAVALFEVSGENEAAYQVVRQLLGGELHPEDESYSVLSRNERDALAAINVVAAAELEPSRLIAEIGAALDFYNEEIRCIACGLLATAGAEAKSMLPALQSLEKDTNKLVQAAAVAAVRQIEDKE